MKRTLVLIGAVGILAIGATAAMALGAAGTSRPSATTGATPTTTSETAAVKVWLCHHTGSAKHPYHLIHVSEHAVAAHRRHGDVDPGAGNTCPTSQPAGAKVHGKSGSAHEKNKAAKHSAAKDDDAAEAKDSDTDDDG